MPGKFFLAPFIVALDLLTKSAVKKYFPKSFQIIENPGIIFQINLPGFFEIFAVAILLGIFVVFFFRSSNIWQNHSGFYLIVGGALSNLLDRIPDGVVTDFIDLGVSVLNLADIAILGGIVLLLVDIPGVKSQTNLL